MVTYPYGQSRSTAMSSLSMQPSFKPVGDSTVPAGYAAPTSTQSNCKPEELAAITKIAGKVLHDPLLMRQVSDRIYELMLEDLRRQQERSGNFGGLLR